MITEILVKEFVKDYVLDAVQEGVRDAIHDLVREALVETVGQEQLDAWKEEIRGHVKTVVEKKMHKLRELAKKAEGK